MEKNDKYNEKLSLLAIDKMLDFFKDILQKTILHVKKIKNLDANVIANARIRVSDTKKLYLLLQSLIKNKLDSIN